jgi:hypothetical protein
MVNLFGSYAEIQNRIEIPIENGEYLTFTRDFYFFAFAAIFLVIAILIWLIAKVLPDLPKIKFPFANKNFWYADKDGLRTRRDILKAWPLTIGASINVFLQLIVRDLCLQNHVDSSPSELPLYWFFISFGLIGFSIVSGIFRFRIMKHHLVVAMSPR